MRQRILFGFIVLTLLTTFSCQQEKRELTAEERNEIGRVVRQTLESYLEDIRSGGLMAEFAYLDSSADFFWVPPGYTSALTFDSVATILKANARMFTTIDNRWETLQINPLHNILAAYTGTLKSTTIDTAGNKTDVRMIESGVMVKRADGWKILCGQSRVME